MRRMYSENQIIKTVEEQDLQPKTLEQQEANFSEDIAAELTGVPSGLTYAPIYNRFEVINNVLYMVLTFSIENPTESDINTGNMSATFVLPEKYAQRIIDVTGIALSATTSTNSICAFMVHGGDKNYPASLNRGYYPGVIANTTTANQGMISLTSSTNNVGSINVIGAGKKHIYSARVFLTIL